MKTDEDYEYHGVTAQVNGGTLQYDEINELIDKFMKNDKGEYLRKLVIDIEDNGDIYLDPTYSARAIDRVKNLKPRQYDLPPPPTVPDLPEREIVKPWPKPQGGAR